MTFEDWVVSVYQGQHAFTNLDQAFRSAWDAAAAAERKAIEPIVFGLCISDNNAQEIVTAIRKRGQG